MKTTITILLIGLFLNSCVSTKLYNRPQVIYSNRDSSFVLISGNAIHFQQRADYKKRKLAERKNNLVNN